MKRLHVHLHVDDLAGNIRFYSALFGVKPEVSKPDYAKWMLDEPQLNFAISTGSARRGIAHLGVQVDNPDELAEIAARGRAAELGGREERSARCCYAQSSKYWFTDPQGIVWEAFETYGAIGSYGDHAKGDNDAAPRCCA